MIKNLFYFKPILFLTSIIIPLYFFSKLIDKKSGDLYIDKPSYVISVKNQQFDYIAGGSSRVHNNFNTLIFDSVSGKKGFNIGYDGSGLAQIYLTLYLFLKNGNTTKYYLQQIEDNLLINPKQSLTYPFQEYFFLPYLDDKEVDECFKRNEPLLKYYLWKYVPYIKYAEFNNYYSMRKVFGSTMPDSKTIELKGYHPIEKNHQPNFPAAEYSINTIKSNVDPDNMYYLKKIYQLCILNKIKFILYTSPLYPKSYHSYNFTNLHDSLVYFAVKNKIEYYNFATHKDFNNDSLFYDETHLNAKGTNLFSVYLGDSLKHILNK